MTVPLNLMHFVTPGSYLGNIFDLDWPLDQFIGCPAIWNGDCANCDRCVIDEPHMIVDEHLATRAFDRLGMITIHQPPDEYHLDADPCADCIATENWYHEIDCATGCPRDEAQQTLDFFCDNPFTVVEIN